MSKYLFVLCPDDHHSKIERGSPWMCQVPGCGKKASPARSPVLRGISLPQIRRTEDFWDDMEGEVVDALKDDELIFDNEPRKAQVDLGA